MRGTPILCLLSISGLCSLTLSISPQYHYVNIRKRFPEAKSYCREMYSDLATVNNFEDMDSLIKAMPQGLKLYIGLERGDVWLWHWTDGKGEPVFFNWKRGEPKKENDQVDLCVAMDSKGQWFEDDCKTKRGFVCFDDRRRRIFIPQSMSWRDAQTHCRDTSTDLVGIRSQEDNSLVQTVSQSQTVWIGLFKDAWRWSDRSSSSFRFWIRKQPNDFNSNQDCVVAEFGKAGQWNDRRCDIRRRFICQGALKGLSTVPPTQKVFTTARLTTYQNSTPPSAPTENSTPTSEPTQNSTPKSTTTINTADHVSTELLTTEIQNTQPTMQTTTTEQTETSTLQMTTVDETASNTAEPTTVTTTGNSRGLYQDNLILVQENMTWSQALGYCRDHHIDLISVTSEVIHNWVARKAANATSPYVWLGLRFTCTFNFWFWIQSDSGCYENWAPGHEPDGQQDCGIVGAIEATGGQQWVSQPETEKLNFICSTCPGIGNSDDV